MGGRRPTFIEIGLGILALGAPLAIGAVHVATIVTLAIIAVLLLGALALRTRHSGDKIAVPWFGAILFGLAAWTAFQALPLPWTLLATIAPKTAAVLEVAFGATARPAWHAMSLAPTATLLEALKVSIVFIAFIVAHNHLSHEGRRQRLLLSFVILASVVTLLGLLGAVVAPGKPLLFYQPQSATRAGGLIATSFVNSNHGGAFLSLSAMAALALALWEENLQRRVMLLAATAFCGLGVTLTLSRGAMGALAFGMVVMVAVATRWRRDRDHRDAWSPQGGMLYVPLALALVLALAAWLAYEPVLKELGAMVPEGQNLAKLELWPSGLAMLKANPLVGVGRGAFATAFPRYLSGDLPGAITFSHLENQYLHLPIELGLPIGGGVIIASFLAWLIWLRNTKHEGSALAFVVILPMVAAHNLVDFNLELLGIALPLAIIAGALSAASTATLHRHRHNRHTDNADTADTSRPRHRRLTTRRIFLALAPALTLGLAVAVPLITPTVPLLASQGGADLLTQIKSQKTADAVRRVLAPAIAAHPADCLPQIFGARALFRLHDRRAIRWVNRALYLCPRSDLAHAEAAQILDAFGHRSQALGECRQALANSSPSHERRLLVWCLARAARIEDVNAALPQRPIVYTHAIGTLLGRRRPKLAAAVAEAAHKRWPAAPHLALTTLSALQAAKRWPDAEALGQKLLKVQASPRLYALHARSLRSSSLASAIEILHEGVRRYPRDLGLRIALVTTLLGPKDKAPALREAAALMPMTRSRNDQIRVHRLLARVYRENGRPHRARYEAQQAAKLLKH